MKITSSTTACLAKLLLLLLLPARVLQAQFTFVTNNGVITLTQYTGPGGAVTIPSNINDMPVISIGGSAFYNYGGYCMTSVTIPDSVTSIGYQAFKNCGMTNIVIPNGVTFIDAWVFLGCRNLASVTLPTNLTTIWYEAFYECRSLSDISIPNSVTFIALEAFEGCSSLTSVTLPNGITNISDRTFAVCTSLTNITIPASVTSIGEAAFYNCPSLTTLYFSGNPPVLGSIVFNYDILATIYYLPGTTNWGTIFGGRPTALWRPQMQPTDASLGVRTNQFGFNIAWASGQVVVVEACTNLANPAWSPLQTNTLSSNTLYFSDPQWTNYPARFYRLRSP